MITQQINWLSRARKAAGAKGPAQADLLEDLNQMVVVANLDTSDYDFLGNVRRTVMRFNVVGVAGQLTTVQAMNPPGSGLLVFVDKLEVFASANQNLNEILITADQVGLPLNTEIHFEDFRSVPNNPGISPVITRAGTQAAAIPPALTTFFVSPTQSLIALRNWVLAPGTGLVLQGGGVNIGLTGQLYYRERPAESGELAAGS